MHSIKKNKKKQLIVVHSVKGGCGKTTVALALAQYFGKKDQKKVCYIDMDIVGVGTISLIGEQPVKQECSMTDFVLLNPVDNPDFFKTDFKDTPFPKFKEFVLLPDINLGRRFNAVFSVVDEALMTRAVQATSDRFFSEDVENKTKIFLEKLFMSEIDTIILDTSPGMQGLTSVILNIAKEMGEIGKLSLEMTREVNVIYICLSTINFAHLRGMWEFLSSSKRYYSGGEGKHSNFLLAINQVPLGVEFISVPEPDIYYSKAELDEMKEEDPRETEFAKHLRFADSSLNHRAFNEYYRLKGKEFLPQCFEQYVSASDEITLKNIGKHVVVLPEQPAIRRISSDFGWEKSFNSKDFFALLDKECENGHLGLLGKQVEKIMVSGIEGENYTAVSGEKQ